MIEESSATTCIIKILMHQRQTDKPGVTRMMAVMMRAHTIRITNKAIAIPLQFLCWVVPPTSSCKKQNQYLVITCMHIFFSPICWLAFILRDQQLSTIHFVSRSKKKCIYRTNKLKRTKNLMAFLENSIQKCSRIK